MTKQRAGTRSALFSPDHSLQLRCIATAFMSVIFNFSFANLLIIVVSTYALLTVIAYLSEEVLVSV